MGRACTALQPGHVGTRAPLPSLHTAPSHAGTRRRSATARSTPRSGTANDPCRRPAPSDPPPHPPPCGHAIGLGCGTPSATHAATYWDTANGSWGTGANWSDNPLTGGTTGTVPLSSNSAVFNQTSVNGNQVITLDDARAITGMTFLNTGTTAIQANSSGTTARTLTLGTGGILVTGGTGAVTLGGGSFGTTSLATSGIQSWTNNSTSTLTITAPVALNNALTIGGVGTTTFTGGNWTGSGGMTKIGSGTMNITGNISSMLGRWTVGSTFGGNFTMHSGALNLSGIEYMTLGDGSVADATYTQTGGTAVFTPSVDGTGNGLYINNSTSGSGTSNFNLSGGSFTINGSNTRTYVGRGANTTTGVLTIGGGSGTATFTTNLVQVATSSGRTGTINLNSNGVLLTSSITDGGGTSNLNFNGGTLRARAASATFLNGLDTAVINSGGATIDTNNFNITIGQAFTGGGRLTKTGDGILTMTGNSSHSGGTTVSQGTLKREFGGTSAANLPVGAFSVASGATLNLDNTNTTVGGLLITDFALTGSGTLSKTNTGSIDIQNGGNLTGFSGLIDVQAGALRLNNILTAGNTNGATLNIASGALVDLRYDSTLAVDKLTGLGTLDHSYPKAYTYLVTVGGKNGSSQFDGVIQNSDTTGLIALTKTGTGTFTLTGTNTYGGTTAVNGGTLEFKNAGGTTRSQTFAALAFAGADGTLQSTWDGGGSISTTFSSLTARTAGNTGNIVLSGGGTNTLTINVGTAGTMIDRGVFFGGSSYAAYGTSGVIRAYGSGDTNYAEVATGTTLGTRAAADNVAITGAITAQDTTTINTLNLGANNLTFQNTASTLSVGGILSSGATNAQIANGTNASALRAATAGGEMVIRVNGSTDKLTIAPVIQNNTSASALTKSGAGTLVLTGVNTYTGTTSVNGGTLRLELGSRSGTAALGTFNVAGGATLNLDNTNTSVGDYYPSGFVLSGAGTLTKTGAGSIDFWTGSNLNNFTGTMDVQVGSLRVNNNTTGANMNQATLNIASGATFDIRHNASLSVDKLTGSGTLDQSYNGGSGLSATIGASNGSSTFSGVIQNGSNQPLAVIKSGAGTLTLAGTNSSYTGVTALSGGVLNVASLANNGSNSSIGRGTGDTVTTAIGLLFQGGTLQYTGSTAQSTNRQIRLGTSGGTIDASGTTSGATLSFTHSAANTNLFETAGARTLTLTGSNTGDNTFAIGLTDQDTNATSLVKSGSGKWVLSGTSTHSGTTTVAAGVLAIGSTGSLASGSTVTVSGGELSVNGTVGGTLVVDAAAKLSGTGGTVSGNASVNGRLAPGASPGTLSFSSNLTLSSTTILEWEFNGLNQTVGGAVNDLATVGGNLTLDGILDGSLFTNFTSVTSGSWRLFNYTGSLVNNNLDIQNMPTLGAGYFSIDTATAGQVNLTVVPEPSAAALGLFGRGTDCSCAAAAPERQPISLTRVGLGFVVY